MSSMEFWGVEVKAGEPQKVIPVPGMVIHLSQACLGETKGKANEPILLNVKVGEQKLVLGLLSLDKFPQLTFDLVFEQPFELSHNWKNGSIHFCGYQTDLDNHGDGEEFDDIDEEESDEEEEEAVPLAIPNGKSDKKIEKPNQAVAKSNTAAAAKSESSGKPKAPVAAPKKADEDEDSDNSDDDSDDNGGSSDDDSDEEMVDGLDSDDDDEEDDSDDDDSDEETPKKPESGKKRPNESASKTPVPAKKGKVETPSRSEGKRGNVHVATPHPAKKGAKTPGTIVTGEKTKSQTPKSGGVTCKSCSRTFGTDKALESHTKAKHA